MTSKENFAATLKTLRLSRDMSMKAFSEELGIALSSLVEYEAGRRMPRGDTIHHMAERLHIPASALISGSSSADQTVISCLDQLTLKIESLHPHARPSAQHALALLRSAFRNSEDLFFLESRDARPENPNDRFRYHLHESRCPPPIYGMLAEERRDEGWAAIAAFAPFSDDRLAVLNIVFTANELQLPPEQFFSDVFPEFISHP